MITVLWNLSWKHHYFQLYFINTKLTRLHLSSLRCWLLVLDCWIIKWLCCPIAAIVVWESHDTCRSCWCPTRNYRYQSTRSPYLALQPLGVSFFSFHLPLPFVVFIFWKLCSCLLRILNSLPNMRIYHFKCSIICVIIKFCKVSTKEEQKLIINLKKKFPKAQIKLTWQWMSRNLARL